MKYNRLNEIELYLSQKQYASIDDLLEKFNISLQTLRRDLKELAGTRRHHQGVWRRPVQTCS